MRRARGRAVAAGALVLVAACASRPTPPDPAGEGLARFEQAFSDRAARDGTRAAFLSVLSDRSTLFRPGPVNGRDFLASRPDPRVDLRWRSQLVAVARSGDLGLSTGPWKMTARGSDDNPGYGQFFTIWTKDANGIWRLLIDHGIDHPGPVGWDAALDTLASDGSRPIEPVTDAELRFNAMSSNVGLGSAYLDFASASLRALREGEAPMLDAKKEGRIAASVFADDGLWTWAVTDSGTSQAGDLGWVMGRYRTRDAKGALATGSYVRVWRSEARMWRVLADVLAPLPAEGRRHGPAQTTGDVP